VSSPAGFDPVDHLPGGKLQLHLWGFMGAGKSTVAQLLARRLVWNYLDLDALIVRHVGVPIAEVFAREGEAAFRRYERHVLAQAVQKPRTVVALGGGTPVAPVNRELAASRAVSIWLQASFEACWSRVGGDPGRPLAGDEAAARELHTAREPIYAVADLTVNAERSAAEVAESVWAALVPAEGSPGAA
jgi:shikimate kinase